MAKVGKLKVYRTPIGFHDAYVAAPSQKAALEAWGADANLFARGMAEVVTDQKLTVEPLSRPGVVIKRARGTAAEHIGALSRLTGKQKKTGSKSSSILRQKPSRTPVEEAERAVNECEARHRAEEKRLAELEWKLAAERRALEQAYGKESEKLRVRLDRAKNAYERAVNNWDP